MSPSIIPLTSWKTNNFAGDNPCYICRLFWLIWKCNSPHLCDYQPLAFGIPPILSKNRFHHSKIKYCNSSTTILLQLCSINHYWLSLLRSHVPPAKRQFVLDMRAPTQGTNIIQEITASHLENSAEMLSLCLNTNPCTGYTVLQSKSNLRTPNLFSNWYMLSLLNGSEDITT